MKAIIEVSAKGSVFETAAKQIASARKGRTPDFRLSFESARSLFAELTPARLDLLDTLRRVGPCSVYALAKAAERNYSNVHTDVARLEELGLLERNESSEISVPYESVEILLPLARAVA
jgi:predicted transcriptional regulator